MSLFAGLGSMRAKFIEGSTHKLAMIGAVYTAKNHRRKGYKTIRGSHRGLQKMVMSSLCSIATSRQATTENLALSSRK